MRTSVSVEAWDHAGYRAVVLCMGSDPQRSSDEWYVVGSPGHTTVSLRASTELAAVLRAAAGVMDQADLAPEPQVTVAQQWVCEEGACAVCGERLVSTGPQGWRHVPAGWGAGPRACGVAAPHLVVRDVRRTSLR